MMQKQIPYEIEYAIEQLVLNGFPSIDAQLLISDIRQELIQQLAQSNLSFEIVSLANLLPVADLSLEASTTASSQELAQQIVKAITRHHLS